MHERARNVAACPAEFAAHDDDVLGVAALRFDEGRAAVDADLRSARRPSTSSFLYWTPVAAIIALARTDSPSDIPEAVGHLFAVAGAMCSARILELRAELLRLAEGARGEARPEMPVGNSEVVLDLGARARLPPGDVSSTTSTSRPSDAA